ncbi:hypothetical protein MKW92_020576 [Papaver armeniacum]|nr:hypothetical protein MKW92_020576 [Papaver armeniacum]
MVLSMTHSQAWCGETVPYKMDMEKMTKLHFYFHDNITGDYPTSFKIAEAPGISNSSSTLFGELYIIDSPLTVGPDPNSRLVGRAQGLYGFSDRKVFSLTMGISLVFTGDKKFNGSTINVFTRNPIADTDREFVIVGGTGYFQFARGFIIAKTYSSTIKNAIVEYKGKIWFGPFQGGPMSICHQMGIMECFSFLVVVMVLSITQSQADQNVNWWSETVPYEMGMKKMTKLHFYLHNNITGDYPTAFKIAKAPGANISATGFGELYMVDNPLTEGPDPNSRLVGRAQGLYGSSERNELSLVMGINLVFTGYKKFNGSTISVFTRNPIAHKEREFAIVGGTRYFRYANGFISAKTYRRSGKNGIVEYNCSIVHYYSNFE